MPSRSFCTDCGTGVNNSQSYCHNCGGKLGPVVHTTDEAIRTGQPARSTQENYHDVAQGRAVPHVMVDNQFHDAVRRSSMAESSDDQIQSRQELRSYQFRHDNTPIQQPYEPAISPSEYQGNSMRRASNSTTRTPPPSYQGRDFVAARFPNKSMVTHRLPARLSDVEHHERPQPASRHTNRCHKMEKSKQSTEDEIQAETGESLAVRVAGRMNTEFRKLHPKSQLAAPKVDILSKGWFSDQFVLQMLPCVIQCHDDYEYLKALREESRSHKASKSPDRLKEMTKLIQKAWKIYAEYIPLWRPGTLYKLNPAFIKSREARNTQRKLKSNSEKESNLELSELTLDTAQQDPKEDITAMPPMTDQEADEAFESWKATVQAEVTMAKIRLWKEWRDSWWQDFQDDKNPWDLHDFNNCFSALEQIYKEVCIAHENLIDDIHHQLQRTDQQRGFARVKALGVRLRDVEKYAESAIQEVRSALHKVSDEDVSALEQFHGTTYNLLNGELGPSLQPYKGGLLQVKWNGGCENYHHQETLRHRSEALEDVSDGKGHINQETIEVKVEKPDDDSVQEEERGIKRENSEDEGSTQDGHQKRTKLTHDAE